MCIGLVPAGSLVLLIHSLVWHQMQISSNSISQVVWQVKELLTLILMKKRLKILHSIDMDMLCMYSPTQGETLIPKFIVTITISIPSKLKSTFTHSQWLGTHDCKLKVCTTNTLMTNYTLLILRPTSLNTLEVVLVKLTIAWFLLVKPLNYVTHQYLWVPRDSRFRLPMISLVVGEEVTVHINYPKAQLTLILATLLLLFHTQLMLPNRHLSGLIHSWSSVWSYYLLRHPRYHLHHQKYQLSFLLRPEEWFHLRQHFHPILFQLSLQRNQNLHLNLNSLMQVVHQ